MTSAAAIHPVHVQGRLDAPLNRWLWLVKWLLVIPHLVVLFFLWIAYFVLSVVAFFAILFTGRYPRSIFDFNVGVLRWTWRVAYYAYGALATDRYPPFSLDEQSDYPATLDISYPAHLSRGLVLVKWLLALPHLVLVTIFIGGGTYLVARAGAGVFGYGGGLVGVLVCLAAVALLFTGRYPQGLFDLVLGLDRWVLRVAAYVGLMTDSYPPFRLDAGGADPATATIGAAASVGAPESVGDPAGFGAPASIETPAVGSPAPPPSMDKVPRTPGRWTAGRIIAVIAGALLVLCGLASATGGAALLIVTDLNRGADGMVSTPTERFHSAGYAIESGAMDVTWVDGVWDDNTGWLGEVRVQAAGTSSDRPLFVGIGSAADVASYLGTVSRDRVDRFSMFPFHADYTAIGSQAPATTPAAQSFWATSSTGVGPQTLTWNSAPGRWVLVVMNADGTSEVTADVTLAAELPVLTPIGWTLIGVGAGLVLIGAGVIVIAVLTRPKMAYRPDLEDAGGQVRA